jgi:hypothetical protein
MGRITFSQPDEELFWGNRSWPEIAYSVNNSSSITGHRKPVIFEVLQDQPICQRTPRKSSDKGLFDADWDLGI